MNVLRQSSGRNAEAYTREGRRDAEEAMAAYAAGGSSMR